MQSSLHQSRSVSVSSREPGVSYDLPILLGWLTLFGVGLKLLVGWPTAPVLPGPHAELERDPGVDPESRRIARWAGVLGCGVGLGRLGVDARERPPACGGRCRRRVDARCALGWLCQACLGLADDPAGPACGRRLAGRDVARPGGDAVGDCGGQPTAASVCCCGPDTGWRCRSTPVLSFAPSLGQDVFDENTDDATGEVTYTVKAGDTLSGIALAYYGDPAQAERIYQANLGREQPNGRQFNRHGLILPGWTLVIPGATQGIVEEHDGDRWYVVKRGDSLRGIAALQLGDEERYRELFDLNVGVARVGEAGPVLQRPELIWPGLQLRLPRDTAPDDAGSGPVIQLLKRQTTRSNRGARPVLTPATASAPDAPGEREMELSPQCQPPSPTAVAEPVEPT